MLFVLFANGKDGRLLFSKDFRCRWQEISHPWTGGSGSCLLVVALASIGEHMRAGNGWGFWWLMGRVRMCSGAGITKTTLLEWPLRANRVIVSVRMTWELIKSAF